VSPAMSGRVWIGIFTATPSKRFNIYDRPTISLLECVLFYISDITTTNIGSNFVIIILQYVVLFEC